MGLWGVWRVWGGSVGSGGSEGVWRGVEGVSEGGSEPPSAFGSLLGSGDFRSHKSLKTFIIWRSRLPPSPGRQGKS